jgi:hypothetical protein
MLKLVDQLGGANPLVPPSWRKGEPVGQETTNRYFDELASGLASGSISRGKALKLMGAALLGGTLASIPGLACAKPHKPDGAKCKRNKQCASGQ